jgi:hypothetical protein
MVSYNKAGFYPFWGHALNHVLGGLEVIFRFDADK